MRLNRLDRAPWKISTIEEIHIDPSLLGGDVEMLEDLIVAAVAEVQKRAADLAQDEFKKVQSVLPFPLPPAI